MQSVGVAVGTIFLRLDLTKIPSFCELAWYSPSSLARYLPSLLGLYLPFSSGSGLEWQTAMRACRGLYKKYILKNILTDLHKAFKQ